MNETSRLIRMLQASAAHNADPAKISEREAFFASANESRNRIRAAGASRKSIPVSLLEGLIYSTKHGVPYPKEPLTSESKVGLDRVNKSLGTSITSPIMAGRFPVLSTSDLPAASSEEQAATASPARGTAMRNNIFKSVRVPEFRFKWMFWAEKGQQAPPKDRSVASEEYLTRPKPLGDQIVSVKEFYQHFNNIPVESLKLRDSIHLFHLGVKPVWEDPRNTRGGAWYFKVSKDSAAQFWHEMCLLAVGDVLQGAVETKRACKPLFFTVRCTCAILTHNSLQRRHLRHFVQCPLERCSNRRLEPGCGERGWAAEAVGGHPRQAVRRAAAQEGGKLLVQGAQGAQGLH